MKFLKSVFIVGMLLLAGLMFFAGDTYNVSGSAVFDVTESYDQVIVYFSPAMTADSTGSFHSKPFYIGDCNDADAFATGITNAASDINVLCHVSNNLRNWVSFTPGGLDAISTTAKSDTLGAGESNASQMHFHNWMIIEVDGQAGANPADRLYLTINFPKDGAYLTGTGGVAKVCRTVDASITNP